MAQITKSAQARAVKSYRERLRADGMARFEVLGLDRDRAMIRGLARRLAEDGTESSRLRSDLAKLIDIPSPAKGGILAALRRSPLVGSDIEFKRDRVPPRDIDL